VSPYVLACFTDNNNTVHPNLEISPRVLSRDVGMWIVLGEDIRDTRPSAAAWKRIHAWILRAPCRGNQMRGVEIKGVWWMRP
jgi:hypothetical protein